MLDKIQAQHIHLYNKNEVDLAQLDILISKINHFR